MNVVSIRVGLLTLATLTFAGSVFGSGLPSFSGLRLLGTGAGTAASGSDTNTSERAVAATVLSNDNASALLERCGDDAPTWEDVTVDTSGFYLNAKCTVLYRVNGVDEKISHGSATTDKLVDALQTVRRAGGAVYNIEIKGHGAPELQMMAAQTFIVVSGKQVLVQLKSKKDLDITPLLKLVCRADVKIDLNGCKTGRGDDSIAKNMSLALPGSTVAGGAFYQAGVPFTSKSWGTKNYFRHGRRVSKWWYWVD